MKKFKNHSQYTFGDKGLKHLLDIKEIDISSDDLEIIKQNIMCSKIQTGVYVFVLKNDYQLYYSKFYSETTGIFLKDGCPYTIEFTPKLTIRENGKDIYTLRKDCILYVGKSKDFCTRIVEHMFSSSINGTASLKLGLKSREAIKQELRLFIVESDEKLYSDLESDIRDKHGCYFGK